MRAVLLIVILLAGCSQPPIFPAGTGGIDGVIVETRVDGNSPTTPVTNASILFFSKGAFVTDTFSDADGKFQVVGLPPGGYEIRAGKFGYDVTTYGAKVVVGEFSSLVIEGHPIR